MMIREVMKRNNEFCKLNLTHQTSESSERPRNSCLWIYFYQHVLLRFYVNLQQPSPVQWRIHQHQQGLMGDVRPARTRIPAIFLQYRQMIVAVQKFENLAYLKIIIVYVKQPRRNDPQP